MTFRNRSRQLTLLSVIVVLASLSPSATAQSVDPSSDPSRDNPDGLEQVLVEGLTFVPDGEPITLSECEELFDVCRAVSVVTYSRAFLVDEDGREIDVDEPRGVYSLGTTAAVGSSTTYEWHFTQIENYYAVIGSNVQWVGSFYETNKITLNGRQSNWRQTSDALEGASIRMTHKWNCVDDNDWLPNTSCSGGWQAHQNPYYQWQEFVSTDSNYHADNEQYWYDFQRSWRASGWAGWVWTDVKNSSHKFSCSGSQCTF